jgi:hypothetical protein
MAGRMEWRDLGHGRRARLFTDMPPLARCKAKTVVAMSAAKRHMWTTEYTAAAGCGHHVQRAAKARAPRVVGALNNDMCSLQVAVADPAER